MARASTALALRRSAVNRAATPPPEELDRQIELARNSFWHFSCAMGKEPVEHMLLWHEELNTGVDSACLLGVAGPDTCILSPRGSAKSTVLILWIAWLIGRHTMARIMLRIVYVSFIIDISRAKSSSIKALIQSPEYQRIFPAVKLSPKKYSDELWGIDFDYAGIDVRGDDAYTICCSGLKGATVSRRSNLVVLDDLIKSVESIENPKVRAEMIRNYRTAIMPTKLSGARSIALGTRFHWDDIFASFMTASNNWRVLKQQAIIEDPETGEKRSYWPQFYPLEDLLERQAMGRNDFEYQYQNESVREGDFGVDKAWLQYGEVPESYDVIGVGIDLSSADKERNDWTVFLLAGRDGDQYWLIDYRRIKTLGNVEKINEMKDLLGDWEIVRRDHDGSYLSTACPCNIWPESVAYQRSFAGDLLRSIRNPDEPLDNLAVKEVKGFRGDKLERLKGIIGLWQRGKVHLNQYRDWSVFESEFLNFGAAAHDDFVDAMVIALTQLAGRSALTMEYAEDPPVLA